MWLGLFVLFLHFLHSDTYSFLLHFMNNITHSASLQLSPFPSLNHTANLIRYLASILSNNPFPYPSRSTN